MAVRTLSAAWVKGIVELLQSTGMEPVSLFEEIGLPMADLARPDARFPSEKISLLWELAAERSGNPAIGLEMSHHVKLTSFDSLAYIMMACPNLLIGLERFVRYLRIISDAAAISLQREEQGYAVHIELLDEVRSVPRARNDFTVITFLGFCQWITGRELHPLAIDFAYPAPDDLQPYRQVLRCQLNFGAPANRLLFSHASLTAPLPTSNPLIAELHDRYLIERLSRLDHAMVSHKVRELIVRRLADGDPLRADIARALCMSERTLQRRLQAEGTSYHELVDEIRRELAQQYLEQHHVTLAQVAYLLGFADQSTFFRSCKRWFQCSPGEYRGRAGALK